MRNKQHVHRYQLCIYAGTDAYKTIDSSDSREDMCARCNEITDPAAVLDATRVSPSGTPAAIYRNAAGDVLFARPAKTSTAQRRAIARYDAENTVQIRLKLNKRTDADILERLDQMDSRQGYIKRLIREDIAKSGRETK